MRVNPIFGVVVHSLNVYSYRLVLPDGALVEEGYIFCENNRRRVGNRWLNPKRFFEAVAEIRQIPQNIKCKQINDVFSLSLGLRVQSLFELSPNFLKNIWLLVQEHDQVLH